MMDLLHDRIVFRMIQSFTAEELKDPSVLAKNSQLYDRLCGCIFGGSHKAVRKFHSVYLRVFKQTLAAKRFIGVDQRLFALLALKHPELVILMPPNEFENQAEGCPYPYPHALWMGLWNYLGDDKLRDGACMEGLKLQIIQGGALMPAPWLKGYPEKGTSSNRL